MKTSWIDRLAFWAIRHALSRERNHRFDEKEFRQFVDDWSDRGIADFYVSDDDPRHTDQALEKLAGLTFPKRHTLKFPTPSPSAWEQNNHIWVEFHLGHPIHRVPMFFIQHGWRSVSVRGYHSMCRRLNAFGINAGVLHLPYHFSRRPKGSFSGELAITSNIARSAYALRQAVQEIRWLKKLLKRLGAPSVGLWGTSYGAWISAMAITLDDGFDAALLLEPPVEIEELFWETPLFSTLQKELNRLKISRASIEKLFRLVTPYHHALKIPPSRVLILGSERDPIGHPDSLRRLRQAWPGAYLEIFPYGHISYRLHTSAVDRFLSILAPQLAAQ